MRLKFVDLATAVFAAGVLGAASAQEAPSPAAAIAPAPGVAEAPVGTAGGPAPAATPASSAAAAGSASTPAAGDAAAPADGASSQPITLKMATVPPPADFKPPSGYRPVKRGLDTIYCTTITPIGSRMPQKYCLTREQVEAVQRQAEIDRRTLEEKVRPPGTSGG